MIGAMTWSAALGATLVSLAVLVIAGALAWFRTDRELRRTRQLGRLAQQTGWSFSPDDVFDHRAMPFALFAGGAHGRAANALLGTTADGRPVCVFDHHPGADPPPDAGATRLTCAVTDLGVTCPRLLVEPEGSARSSPPDGLERVPGAAAGFTVWTDDPPAARVVADSLGSWLARSWPDARFEIADSLLLVWLPRLPVRRVPEAVRASDGLRARLPAQVCAPISPGASGPGIPGWS